jgi:hypothetical protein
LIEENYSAIAVGKLRGIGDRGADIVELKGRVVIENIRRRQAFD